VALSVAINDIISELPRRLHEVVDRRAAATPGQLAVIDHTNALSFEELRRASTRTAARWASWEYVPAIG
jgi:long-chain acyl-CoA synthetase